MTGDTPLTRFLSTLTLGQLREMKADARNEIDAAEARVEELRRDLARIEQAITEKAGGRRSAPVPRHEPSPNGQTRQAPLKDAILAAMRTQPPETIWTTQDVLDELQRRGSGPGGTKPLNTVGNRMAEMGRALEIHKIGRGKFALSPSAGLFSTEEKEVPAM